MQKIHVIGSGFAGLSAATALAHRGYDVTILEKNESPGGRARVFDVDGFRFDMGPSWYWMPEVFESYFKQYGHTSSDFYTLQKLSPSFRMFFGANDYLDVPSEPDQIVNLFESIETGAGKSLERFMAAAKEKYEISMTEFVRKPGLSLFEFFRKEVLVAGITMKLVSSFGKLVREHFSDPRLIALMDFPVLFLGASSHKTPALYSMMNYAGLYLGTWYPKGGMHEIIKAFVSIAKEQGVEFEFDSPIRKMIVKDHKVVALEGVNMQITTDAVIAAGDYHHMESLLEPGLRNYSESYWDTRTMSPSSLIFYLGLSKRLSNLKHHSLFFDESLDLHSHQIYNDIKWPDKPLFYTCTPSLSDSAVAPDSHENLFVLIPIASGLKDSDEVRNKYFNMILERLNRIAGEDITKNIVYKRSYALNDFKEDYNAYKGNAYGLANTLTQTAILKPKLTNRKIRNLVYAGQLTVPGPGVPPSIISGEIAAEQLIKQVS